MHYFKTLKNGKRREQKLITDSIFAARGLAFLEPFSQCDYGFREQNRTLSAFELLVYFKTKTR